MEQLKKTSTLAYKRCWKCKEVKLETEFHKYAYKRQGRCKNCSAVYWRKYVDTVRGRERHNEAARTYWHSERGKDKYNVYRDSGQRAKMQNINYHWIQEEAGCHLSPDTFYSAYRFLKALENAEIIDT